MSIDWLTVGAQVINFLILVYLLHRFLYHPIINAMDRREERIARRMEEADERESEAEEAARVYREKQEALEQERQQRLDAAEEEAEARRQELLTEAREEVREARRQWESDLAREQEELRRGMRRAAVEAVARITRRVLADLADADLEARMVDRFLERLADLDEEERTALRRSGHLTVQTAFPLGDRLRETVRQGLEEQLRPDPEARIAFETTDHLVCGIEVSGAGRKAGWSVDQYLADLEETLEKVLGGALAGGEGAATATTTGAPSEEG
jgi:F-type H+-transporting ATPase subunit b